MAGGISSGMRHTAERVSACVRACTPTRLCAKNFTRGIAHCRKVLYLIATDIARGYGSVAERRAPAVESDSYHRIVIQRLHYRSCRNDVVKLHLYKSSNVIRIARICVCVCFNWKQQSTVDNDRSGCGSLPLDGNDHAKITRNRGMTGDGKITVSHAAR